MTLARDILPIACIACWLLVVLVLVGGAACGSSRPRETPAPAGEPSDHAHEGHGHSHVSHAHGTYADAEHWSTRFDDPARDAWQRPDEVLRALALTPTMTVADVGAGTGYFAVRLARAVPHGEVIATDLESAMVRYLEDRARREQLPNLRAVRASPTTSGLAPGSVDAILVVHVWHHLGDRASYARDLAAALRPGGRLLVVDFSPAARRGPPIHMRLAPEALVTELAAAGLAAQVSPIALPDQYIVEARRPAP
jgi:arsenite methyltransferase